MREVTVTAAQEQLPDLIDDVVSTEEAVVISSENTPVAVLVDPASFQRLRQLADQALKAELDKALEGKTYPLSEVLDGLDIKV